MRCEYASLDLMRVCVGAVLEIPSICRHRLYNNRDSYRFREEASQSALTFIHFAVCCSMLSLPSDMRMREQSYLLKPYVPSLPALTGKIPQCKDFPPLSFLSHEMPSLSKPFTASHNSSQNVSTLNVIYSATQHLLSPYLIISLSSYLAI